MRKKDSNFNSKKLLNDKKSSDSTLYGVKVNLKKYSNTKFNLIEVIVLITTSMVFGIIVGCIVAYGKGDRYDYYSSTKSEELIKSYNNILNNFYGEISEDDLINAAVDGMVSSLKDPYSNYMDNIQSESFNQKVDGSYIGIGVSISKKDSESSYIAEVYEDSPADKAGIKVGDILVEIDKNSVLNSDMSEITSLIKGKKHSKIEIKVLRDDKEKKFVIERDNVEIRTVNSKFIEVDTRNIGYINIETFSANTYNQFQSCFNYLIKENIDSLIIDVRDNPGGHLSQVQKILSLFFDKKTILYQIESKGKTSKIKSSGNKVKDLDIVILVNANSASASEILASCFKDNYKNSSIIGHNSYGKGTVQQELVLSTGSSIKYTTQKWLTSKGKWLEGIGVEVDYEVDQSSEYYIDYSDNNDNQLQKAIEILENKES